MCIRDRDSAILIFEPEYKVKDIQKTRKTTNNRFFTSGERSKSIMDVLREANGQNLTSEEIALQVVEKRSLELDSHEFKALVMTIIDGLRDLKLKQIVKETSRVNNTPRYTILLD